MIGNFVTNLFVTILLLVYTLQARDNPFFATVGEKDITYTSNETVIIPPLKKAQITLPNQARVLQSVTVTYKNLDGSIEKKKITLNNTIDWHLPIYISQHYNQTSRKISKKNTKKFSLIAKIPFAKFYVQNKTLKIKTDDKLLRSFLLVSPHRIVLDFKRTSHLKSFTKINKNSIFKKIKIGNHSDYYRVVLELDGYYKYTLNSKTNEIIITLY